MQQLLDGRYEILKPLSSGGFGKTYLARDLRIPGTPSCVVKQLHCVSHDPQDIQLAQQLFQREAESLAKLGHHDQIPRLLAYFTEHDEFFLVEDYIAGQSLEDEIQTGQPWPETAVIDLIHGILEVLAYVHSQGVIHRDIKPGNLIRRQSDGKIVLIDFGAIKQLEQVHPGQAHRTGTQIGTAGYMPPEQAQGKPRPNSDIYGIGMVAISAITGQPAIGLPDDPQTGEIVWQHLAPVSSAFAPILTRMVRYHFQHRYQTVTEVQQDLHQLSVPHSPHPVAPNIGTESVPTQVASPGSNQSRAQIPALQSPQKSKGPPWLLGVSLAILIPILGGTASLLFNSGITTSGSTQTSGSDPENDLACQATVNGNIRSERTAYLGNQNILQTGQGQSFEIGTKETRGGWIEIKLPSGRTAWTHLDVVANESALKACLNRANIVLQTISDIPAPPRPKPLPPVSRPTPAPEIEAPDLEEIEDLDPSEDAITNPPEASSAENSPSDALNTTENAEESTPSTPETERTAPSSGNTQAPDNDSVPDNAPSPNTPPNAPRSNLESSEAGSTSN